MAALGVAMVVTAAGCGGGSDGGDASGGGGAPVAAGCDRVDLSQPPAAPVEIRMAHGFVVDEPLWLLEAKPELTRHRGRWYTQRYTAMRGNEDRFTAFQAGQADAITTSAPALVKAIAQRIPLKAVATEIREARDGFQSTYVARADSGIRGFGDLKGRKIGIVDFGSSTDYWARAAVKRGGFDHTRDAEYVVVPFPAQEEALRRGQIDVAVLVEPFHTLARQKGGLVDVFTSLQATGAAQEPVQFVTFGEKFLEGNPGVVCAWIDDLKTTTAWYLANLNEARRVLVEKKFVQIPLETYQASRDYSRPANAAVDTAALDGLIADLHAFGILRDDQRVSAADIVAAGFAPTP